MIWFLRLSARVNDRDRASVGKETERGCDDRRILLQLCNAGNMGKETVIGCQKIWERSTNRRYRCVEKASFFNPTA